MKCRITVASSVLLLNKLFSDGIIVSHLPDGPTAHFKLTNVKLGKDVKVIILLTETCTAMPIL